VKNLNRTDRLLCAFYAALAVAALVGTQLELVRHLTRDHDSSLSAFLSDVVATPAATFSVIDLVVVASACVLFMVVEGRRLGVPRFWVYVVLTFAVAVSVAFPAFLIARQLRLAADRTG
jgi:hypothetical protein